MSTDDSLLGALLRRHRAAAGLTQEELAERAGISARTISDVERGLRTSIYRETALRLARALDLEEGERSEFERATRGRNLGARLEASWMSAQGPGPGAGLPPPPTRLIGREGELQIVLEALTDPQVRLVTLTGPGGVGKTRIAVEAASRAQGAFRDGVFFVSLGASREPGPVLAVVAHALGVRGPREPLLDAVAERLSGKRSLVVLDTFEHVLDAAPMVGELLAATPGLTVLVTSREALHLRTERELAVPTLALPPEESAATAEVIGRYPATALFVERARARKPELVIDERAAEVMVGICRSVNGLPLAIELAAGRVKHLPLPSLRDHLDHRLSVLRGGPRDLPRRQQTMRDTVAWSYDLLEPAEQPVFRALSVFAGGWTLQAAACVCAADEVELLAILSALLDKSLVGLAETAGQARYWMLDVIGEYAAEQRDARGEAEALLRRHADYFLSVAEAAGADFGRAAQETSFEVLETEHDNLRAALGWTIERRQAETALRLAAALWPFWMSRGYHSEGRRWLRRAMAVAPAGPAWARVKALWGAAWLAYHQGHYEEMQRLGEELLPLARTQAEPIDIRNALTVRGMVAMAQGRYAEALVPLREALDICRRLEPSWLLATSLLNLGMASLHAGETGNAAELLAEARAQYDLLGDRHFTARAVQQSGHLALVRGDHGAARSLICTSLGVYRDLGDLWGVAESLEGLSACDAADGMAERAACAAGAALAIRERLATRPLPFDRDLTDRYLARARTAVDHDVWRAATETGRAMRLDQAIEYCLMPPDRGHRGRP